MNTPAHLLIGWAAFGRKTSRGVACAALFGALAPDLSLYLLAGTSLFLLNIPANIVFDELYFSPQWQTIFGIDNSFVVWGAVFGLGVYLRKRWVQAMAGAALLHVGLDFPLHHDDGRAHFWPITNWVFESPVSYWDRGHHAEFVAPIEAVIAGLCAYSLATVTEVVRWRSWRMVGICTLMLLEIIAILPPYFIDFGS